MSDHGGKASSPRLPAFLRRTGDIALSLGAVVLLAASGTVGGDLRLFGVVLEKSTLLLVIGGTLFLAEAILAARRNVRLAWFENEFPVLTERAALGEKRLLELMRQEVEALARLAKHYSNERVSLYRKDEDAFTLVARCSRLDGYEESLGRESLPLDQGVIGVAWRDGSAVANSFPSAGQLDHPPTRQWQREQERWGVSPDLSRQFVMRSQAYAAFRLFGEDARSRGVLMFESTTSAEDLGPMSPGGPILDKEELETFVKPASPRLATLLRFSHAIPRAHVRELLEELQGASRDRTE